MIPVYIVTGFIGSGKSTFINEQLQYRKKLGGTAIISAEEGRDQVPDGPEIQNIIQFLESTEKGVITKM